MNTRIGCIARLQSRLALENVSPVDSFANGDDDEASATSSNDEMTTSQWSTFVYHDKKEE